MRYTEPKSILGARIMRFRKSNRLTQADLAERYGISGPAVFKFEKGFVTPSLKLWQKIAADMDIPEKEAVLIWVKEKLPEKLHPHLRITAQLDENALLGDLEQASKKPDPSEQMRNVILDNPDVAPSLKAFVSDKGMWKILNPSLKEVAFLIRVDQQLPRLKVSQFRDLMVVARAIQKPED